MLSNSKTLVIQKARGYKLHGKVVIQALPISIENERGSYRSGVDADGHEWDTFMYFAYGGIRGTEGSDGDNVDVYLGHAHYSTKVFIVHQNDPTTGNYDENKVMLFFNTAKEAKQAYMKQYDRPGFFGSIDEVDMQEFKKMLKERYGMQLKKGYDNPRKQNGTGPHKGDGAKTGQQKGDCKLKLKLKKEGKSRNKEAFDYDAKELAMGIKIEMEHTSSRGVAEEIAKDHLEENPKYYTKYEAKMEKSVRLLIKAKGKKLQSGETTERKDGTYMKVAGGKFKKLNSEEIKATKTRKGKGVGTRIRTVNKPSYNKNLFTPFMIGRLRKEYAGLKTIDPAGKGYAGITKLLDGLDKVALKQLADSDINFVSMLAKNRLPKEPVRKPLKLVKKSIVIDPINAKRICDGI